ncbi:MAG: hypothetical protein E7K72_24795 [Roseomonas mucosa]|nr:hypothetical protein [Roseomonas mucosa]
MSTILARLKAMALATLAFLWGQLLQPITCGVATYVLRRLREPGTLLSVTIALASMAGVTLTDGQTQMLLMLGSLLSGTNALLPDLQHQATEQINKKVGALLDSAADPAEREALRATLNGASALAKAGEPVPTTLAGAAQAVAASPLVGQIIPARF